MSSIVKRFHNSVSSSSNRTFDIQAVATTEKGEQLHFICEVKSSGEPRHIRNAVKQLIEYREYYQKISKQTYCCMVSAPYISPQSSIICEQHDVGYIDLSGNCLIACEGLYIRVEGKANKYKETRKTRAIFDRSAVKSSVILRTMLSDAQKQWRVQDLAEASASSIGQASNVKRVLEEKELAVIGARGFYISKPDDLLEQWAATYHLKPNTVIECYSADSAPEFERKLAELGKNKGVDYALTGFAGGVRYAPAVRYTKVHVYIPLQDVQESIEYLELKRVNSGSNVSIIVPYDPCVLLDIREVQGCRIASPVQVCLELLGLKGRGEELAEAILNGGFQG